MHFMGFYFRPRLWPTVMTIPILIILCLLGNWQMARLAWKLDLTHKLETRYGLPAVDLLSNVPANLEDVDDWIYRHVKVSGRFLHQQEMPLYGVGPNGKPGYDLFTPLVTTGGKYVIVNRGWVPESLKEQGARPETIKTGDVQVTGILRKSWKKERFAPENDLQRNIWYYGDLDAMAKAQGLDDVFPMFLYADKAPEQGEYPIGGRTRLKLVNNHLDYAMTWYGLAIVLLIIYLVFNTRRYHPTTEQF